MHIGILLFFLFVVDLPSTLPCILCFLLISLAQFLFLSIVIAVLLVSACVRPFVLKPRLFYMCARCAGLRSDASSLQLKLVVVILLSATSLLLPDHHHHHHHHHHIRHHHHHHHRHHQHHHVLPDHHHITHHHVLPVTITEADPGRRG